MAHGFDALRVEGWRFARAALAGGRAMARWVVGGALFCCVLAEASAPAESAKETPDAAGMKHPLAARMADPPAASRMLKIIHGWPDSAEGQDRLIATLQRQGFGGVVCNVSFADYLESEAKWEAFKRAVRSAREAGFAMWLYDEKGYPSGTAGGLVLRNHPEWEASGLLVAEAGTTGGPVSLRVPPGELLLAAGLPVRAKSAELSGATNLAVRVRGGELSWAPKDGEWKVVVITRSRLFEGTHAAMSLSDHIPYPNLLQSEPTARFLEVTHEQYARRLGPDELARSFIATFTDEPSLMSLFLKPMPYRVLPWAPDLPQEFKRRRGYDLEPVLPSLVVDTGSAAARHRYDFWQTIGELVSERFFGQIQEWCARHDLLSGGHLLMEENLVNHIPLYGHFLQCLRRLDAPSIDCLTSLPDEVPWVIAKMAAGAAALENREFVMCETSDHAQAYRPKGDTRPVRMVSPGEIRGTCNRLMVAGVNVITSYYTFAGLSDEELRALNAWVGRGCAALTGGHSAAEVAVVMPVESLWPRFVPARHLAKESAAANEVESVFHNVTTSLFTGGWDFVCIDAQALAQARVEGGVLAHGALRWRVVVLPGIDTLPAAAWDTLARFVEAGGMVVAVGAQPTNSERDFPCAQATALAERWFEKGFAGERIQSAGPAAFVPAGQTPWLPALLNGRVANGLQVHAARHPVRHTHRRIEGQEVFLVINDRADPWSGTLSFRGVGPGVRWDLESGAATAVKSPAQVPVQFGPFDAALFTFPAQGDPSATSAAPAALPRLVSTPIALKPPMVSRGEFVREKLEGGTGSETGERWRVQGTITRGDVDTFLFLRFPVEPGARLAGLEMLVFETETPPGQQTPAELLLILHEQGGADYLAHTGRWLGSPGRSRTLLPVDRLRLAGWSTDSNQRLDLDQVSEIRIGWGGYYGVQDEVVDFTVDTMRTGRLE